MKHYLIALLCILLCIGCVGAYPLHQEDDAVRNALDYLRNCQQEDGGFGEAGRGSSPGTTSWAILAIFAAGEDPRTWVRDGNSPVDYLTMMNRETIGKGGTTDIARTILTLHAVSEDPRSFHGVNYVQDLKSRVKPDGQAGDHVYTTIWTIIGLASAGEDTSRSVSWLISAQNPDGGFPWTPGAESDPDDTGAALQALIAGGVSPDDPVVRKAVEYLRSMQRDDGGYHYGGTSASNSASDAWVIQGLVAAGEDPRDYRQNSRSVIDHLLSLQNPDGSFRHTAHVTDNPCRMTATALPALLGAPNPIMTPAVSSKGPTQHRAPPVDQDLPEVKIIRTETDRIVSIRDDFGEEITIHGYPQRIVSLAPSNTEILFALGLSGRVVGVTDYCDYPAEAAAYPKVGGYSTINLEKVIAAEPDLVLAAYGNTEDMITRMRSLGLVVVALNPTDLEGVINNIELIGEITGADTEASALSSDLNERIRAVHQKTSRLDTRPSAAHLVWYDPLWISGGRTFQSEVIQMAGGTNSFEYMEEWSVVGFEDFIMTNPEFIFVSSGTGMGSSGYDIIYEYVINEPRFQNLDAVKKNQVILIDADIISRASPRIVDALEEVAAAMHPDLFEAPPVSENSPVQSPVSGLIPLAALLSMIILLGRRGI